MGKQKTWEQYYRRHKNKYQAVDDFIGHQLEIVVTEIEDNGISAKSTLLLLQKINKECNIFAEASELYKGWKIAKDWFPMALLQTCLNGRSTVHYGFSQKVALLYHHLGWDFIVSEFPSPKGLQDRAIVYWTSKEETTAIDLLVYPTGEFPIGSVLVSSSNNTWEVLEVGSDEIKMRQNDYWGNKRVMSFGINVVRGMRRVL